MNQNTTSPDSHLFMGCPECLQPSGHLPGCALDFGEVLHQFRPRVADGRRANQDRGPLS